MLRKITSISLLTPVLLSANGYFELMTQEETSVWMSLFALAIVSVVSLFLSSEQLKELDKKHRLILQKEKEIEKKQQVALELISHKIETSTKGIVTQRKMMEKSVIEKREDITLKDVMKEFAQTEAVLLDATHDLVDFLQLKSGTLHIKQESYKLSNVLSQVYSTVSKKLDDKNIQFIYDISVDITDGLLGDSKRIEQVFNTLLNDAMDTVDNSYVIMKSTLADEKRIIFELISSKKFMLADEITSILEDYKLHEAFKSEEKLYLYVAHQIIRQMKGSLDIVSDSQTGTTYIVTLPYSPLSEAGDIPKNMVPMKALVGSRHPYLQEVIKQRLALCDLSVTMYHKDLDNELPTFDLIILDDTVIDESMSEKLKVLKRDKTAEVVILKDSFTHNATQIKGVSYVNKPFQNKIIFNWVERAKALKTKSTNDDTTKRKKENEEKIEVLKEKQGVTRECFTDFSHLHILLVDDNPMNQKILQGIFSTSGILLSFADNGQEAIDKVKHNSEIDLVFMDTNMPVMDGYEATWKIREIRNRKSLPIIAMESATFDVHKSSHEGFNAFLHKPFRVGQLYTALERFTSEDRSTVKHVFHKLQKYEVKKHILDIHVGIGQANTAIFYKEVLREVNSSLKQSDKALEGLILSDDKKALKSFILDTIRLTEIIGANGLRQVLIEMIQTFDYKQEHMLLEYLPHYKKDLALLMSEIEVYLKT